MAACEVKDGLGLRDRAILELLYSSGLRRFEVCNLKVWDVNTSERTVTVRAGKGKKDRIVPMGERAALWIAKYRDEIEIEKEKLFSSLAAEAAEEEPKEL